MSIGKAKRKFIDQEKLMLPGVGSYNVQHSEFTCPRGRSFTRATRSITQTNQSVNSTNMHHQNLGLKPGPGSYSVDLKRRQKIITFTQSKRFYKDTNKVPGPGSYKSEQCSKQKIKAGIISRSARITVQIRENIPGPGDYVTPQIVVYKKKEPVALFGKAKRNLGDQSQKQFFRTNKSKENLRKTDIEALRENDSARNATTFERTWQGRKLQKQAKLVKKDEILINGQ